MTSPRRRVLVLGRDERAFLSVVRSLGRRGLAVHVAWCPEDAVARRSRYVARAHDLPPYTPGDDGWLGAFEALCRSEAFDLIVPCSDPTLIPLVLHRTALEPLARLAVPDERGFAAAFDKHESHSLARSLGVRVPREETFPTPADPEAVLAAFALPVVLKPRASFEARDLGRKRFVRIAADRDALARGLAAFADAGTVIVQESVPGVGAGVELLAAGGRILVAFQHERVHEPRRGGGSSYRRSVALRPALRDAAARLMEALAWTGVAMVEFRVDPATDDWAFIEINGRFWGSLPLALAAGVDFPYYLYQLLVEGRHDFPQGYPTGMYCRNWLRDATWLAENLRAPRAARVPLARLAAELGPALALRERSDTLVFDDPRPGFAEAGRLARRVGGAALGRVRARLVALPPVRRRRAARARRALGTARHVLFVCKGNICRSPFAEAYARTAFGDGVAVASSGYFPRAGRPSPREAVEAAREAGVDLVAHRSRVLSDEDVHRAEVIFVFDEENLRTVAARYPSARRRLHRLADASDGGPPDIADPYGGGPDDFRTAYRRIARALDALARPA